MGFGNATLTPDNRHPIVCPKEVAGVPSLLLITDESLHASCSPIADFYLFTFNNDRHFPYTFGHFEHFLELFLVVSNVYVSGLVSVSRPGFFGVRSRTLTYMIIFDILSYPLSRLFFHHNLSKTLPNLSLTQLTYTFSSSHTPLKIKKAAREVNPRRLDLRFVMHYLRAYTQEQPVMLYWAGQPLG